MIPSLYIYIYKSIKVTLCGGKHEILQNHLIFSSTKCDFYFIVLFPPQSVTFILLYFFVRKVWLLFYCTFSSTKCDFYFILFYFFVHKVWLLFYCTFSSTKCDFYFILLFRPQSVTFILTDAVALGRALPNTGSKWQCHPSFALFCTHGR